MSLGRTNCNFVGGPSADVRATHLDVGQTLTVPNAEICGRADINNLVVNNITITGSMDGGCMVNTYNADGGTFAQSLPGLCEVDIFGNFTTANGPVQVIGDGATTLTVSLAPGDCWGQYFFWDTLNNRWSIAANNTSPIAWSQGETNTYLGCNAGNATSVGIRNTIIGNNAASNINTDDNVIIGADAAQMFVSGGQNVGVGVLSGQMLVDGVENVFVGGLSGPQNVSVNTGINSNVCVGHEAGVDLSQDCVENVLVGHRAGFNVGSGPAVSSGNVCMGRLAGDTISSGDDNVIIGRNADTLIGSVSQSVCVGGSSSAGDNGVHIGFGGSSDTNSVSIGSGSLATNSGISIGRNTIANAADSVAIGRSCIVNGGSSNSIVIGDAMSIPLNAPNNILIGTGSTITGAIDNCVCLGSNSSITGSLGISIGSLNTATNSQIAIGNNIASGANTSISLGNSINPTLAGFYVNPVRNAAAANAVTYNPATLELVQQASSQRFKHDIVDLADQKDKIDQLRPVTFKYNEGHEIFAGKTHIGLIAEEVEQVYPEFVVYEADGVTPSSITYADMVSILIKEIQSLRKRVSENERQLSELRS